MEVACDCDWSLRFGSNQGSKMTNSSSEMDCPWDTIRMVPTPTVAGDQTSLDSQLTHDHVIFQKPELVPEEIRGFLSKAPKTDPIVLELFAKNNPIVPGPMSPK